MKNKLFPRKVQVMKAKKGKKTSFGKRWETAVCCSARIVYQLWACIGDLTWGAAFCSLARCPAKPRIALFSPDLCRRQPQNQGVVVGCFVMWELLDWVFATIQSENGLAFLGMFMIAFLFLLRRAVKGLQNKRAIQRETSGAKRYPLPRINPKPQTACLLDDLVEKCSAPLANLAVHIDFPRLAGKFCIYRWARLDKYSRQFGPVPELSPQHILLDATSYGLPSPASATARSSSTDSLLAKGPPNRGIEHVMHDILVVLCKQFRQDAQIVLDQFIPTIKGRNLATGRRAASSIAHRDISEDLRRFLSTMMGDPHPVVRLLKACNQSTIAPAAIRLKVDIGSKHPYKDKRGSWRIDIVLITQPLDHLQEASPGATSDPAAAAASSTIPSPASSSFPDSEQASEKSSQEQERGSEKTLNDDLPITEVLVRHSKRECSWGGEEQPESHFEFTWHLSMAFSHNMEKLEAAQVQITDVYFNPAMPSKEQQEVIECLSPYMESEDRHI